MWPRPSAIGSAQITRLEAAAIKLSGACSAPPGPRRRDRYEREELAGRLERLRKRSRASRRAARSTRWPASRGPLAWRPSCVGCCIELVTRLHRDPSVALPDVRPFQQRLSGVSAARAPRGRGRALEGRARLPARRRAWALAATAEELPPDGAPGLPFHEERAAIVTRLEMAQVAARDAHREFVALAHDWPELSELARRPDWTKLPFAALQRSLMPPDEPAEGAPPEPATRLRSALAEAYQAIRATALWLQELRTHVQQVPRPD